MNLKRLEDSLQFRNGKLFYRSMEGDALGNNKESKLDRTGIFGFGVNRNNISVRGKSVDILPSGEPIADRIYSLLQIDEVEGFGTAKEVQKFIKNKFEELDSRSLTELFKDLQWQFDEVMAQATEFIEKLYSKANTVTVRLHSVKSSSHLVKWFIKNLLKEDVYEIGGKEYHLSYGGDDFIKSPKVEFDVEAYVDDVVAKGGDKATAKKQALKYTEELKNDLNADGTLTLHKSSFSSPKRTSLRKYIKFLEKSKDLKRGMADIFIDDFTTTGATIEAAMRELGEKDGSTFGVAMFRVK